MKNIFIIFLLFLLVTFTFSLDNWLVDEKCPEGTERGCAAFGRKTICVCARKCKKDEFIQCGLHTFNKIRCSCEKKFNSKKRNK